MKFGFVVLHYLTTEDTIRCVKSIQDNVGFDVDIVIVDNHSSNGSLERLKAIFEEEKRIYFLSTKSNLGFAQGNNIGYTFCREKLGSNVIVCLNNDIILNDTNFTTMILKHLTTNIGIIGPDIVTVKTGTHQNPMKPFKFNKVNVWIEIFRYFILYVLNFLGIAAVIRVISSHQQVEERTSHLPNKSQHDQILHGSCLIFTPAFIRMNSMAFDPRTFLYLEENILFLHIRHQQLHSLYLPEVRVNHVEDSSTNASTASVRSKKMFIARNLIKSNLVLLKLIKKEKTK